MNDELIIALKAGLHWARKEQMDMLCKAGAYSERTYEVVSKSAYWLKVMGDVALLEAALAKLGVTA